MGSDTPLSSELGSSSPDIGPTGTRAEEASSPIRFGSLYESSPPRSPFNWALVRIENPEVIQLANPPSSELFANKVLLEGRHLYPKAIQVDKGTKVLICLGSVDIAVEGEMSAPSFSDIRTPRVPRALAGSQEGWRIQWVCHLSLRANFSDTSSE